MKEQAHNEIDLMLRKLGSAGSGASENGNHLATSSNSGEHLDADELNMYAENALPLKTRARYTEHLVDCQQCRQIVSQLSQAAGIVVVEEKNEAVQEKSKLSEFFSSLISPMVLKYALPTVLLLTVASIGFFTLRSSTSRNADVAQSKAVPATQTSQDKTSPEPQHGLINPAEPDKQAKPSEPQASPDTRSAAAGPTDEKKEAKREAPTTVDDLAANADTPAAPAPPVARHDVVAKKPAETEEKRQESKEVAGNKNTSTEGAQPDSSIAKTQPRSAAKIDEANKKLEEDEAESRKAKSAATGRAQSQSRAEQQQEPFRDRGRRRQDKDDVEVRSVAGRSFHRENGVWIDSAYNPSNAMTRVSRGSEQFRALVADEPEIKRIADQLPGDVIVVWKGRVYRIE